MQCIPSVRCKVTNKAKLMLVPLLLTFTTCCHIRHFLCDGTSLDDILDISITINCIVASVQILFSIAVLNIGLKNNHREVQKYFENIVESSEEFMSEAREEHLSKSLQLAYKVVRFFFLYFVAVCQFFPAMALYQTNFVSPLYYRLPGIPSSSPFFYPVNIIGQYFNFFCLVTWYIIIDCLFFIYLFYIRGEMRSITAIAELLSQKETLTSNCNQILRSVCRAHYELFQGFRSLSQIVWHYYCYKLLGLILITCSSSVVYSRTNSIVSGPVLHILAIALLTLVCVPGQLVDDSLENLRETLYQSLWYEMKSKDQRNFLLIFNASQKNINAETFGVGKISFSTLVQVVKTTISYAAFVYTVLM
ncbi:hypothetical protein DMENIID0001_054680 [Sergentomyia squamirostris]